MKNPQVVALQKDHVVVSMPEAEDFDIILSEKAWRMTDELADCKLLKVAITAAQQHKYRKN
jgi:hypothetical protein